MGGGESIRAGEHRNFHLRNFSGAFSLIAGDAVDAVIDDGWDLGPDLAQKRKAILMGLPGDNSFYCRLVFGRPLNEEENAEWIAKATGSLSIKDGGLLVCSGFDPDLLEDWKSNQDELDESVYWFDLPPADYAVDIYTHRPAMAGRYLEKSWPTPLGPWFRASYPGEKIPSWMAMEFLYTTGASEEFAQVKKAAQENKDPLDGVYNGAIGYLIHINKGESAGQITQPSVDGFIGYETGARIPAQCPRGLISELEDFNLKTFVEGIAD
ncbi:MAG: hypothetical protein OEV92_03565 [Nitrospinota bacterium]|nr:hypothetical protein [Nitrospinota bacterium]